MPAPALTRAEATAAGDVVAELEPPEVARQLVAILGRPLVALITGVSATRVVRAWEENGRISPENEQAIRVALQAALIVKTQFKDGVVRNWFVGHNTVLADRAPGELVRELATTAMLGKMDLGRSLLSAARAFVAR
jgi:hypothetical protein